MNQRQAEEQIDVNSQRSRSCRAGCRRKRFFSRENDVFDFFFSSDNGNEELKINNKEKRNGKKIWHYLNDQVDKWKVENWNEKKSVTNEYDLSE